MQQRRLSGFTLIELLVVIAIIAILAAILFPVFAQAREKARSISCLSNMNQISLAVMQYTEDYDETYPQATDTTWDDPWSVEVTPYIKSVQAFHCPDDSAPAVPAAYSWAGPGMSYVVNASFGWNPEANSNEFNGLFFPPGDLPTNASWIIGTTVRSLASVNFPASTVMVTERDAVFPSGADGCGTVSGMGGLYSWGPSWVGSDWTGYSCGGGWDFGPTQIPNGSLAATTNIYDPTGQNGGVMAVHQQMANFAFADGHVKAMHPAATDPQNYATGNAGNMWIAERTQQ